MKLINLKKNQPLEVLLEGEGFIDTEKHSIGENKHLIDDIKSDSDLLLNGNFYKRRIFFKRRIGIDLGVNDWLFVTFFDAPQYNYASLQLYCVDWNGLLDTLSANKKIDLTESKPLLKGDNVIKFFEQYNRIERHHTEFIELLKQSPEYGKVRDNLIYKK